MKYFLTITLFFITLLPATAAKKIEANPINIAAIIVEKTDSAQVASTLEYYGYALQGTNDGYQVMKHPNGTEIRFTFNEDGITNQYPTVIVTNPLSSKQLSEKLNELNFEKSSRGYERTKNQFSRYATKCNIGPKNTLIFSRTPTH